MRVKQVSVWAGNGQEMKGTEPGCEGQKTNKTGEKKQMCPELSEFERQLQIIEVWNKGPPYRVYISNDTHFVSLLLF